MAKWGTIGFTVLLGGVAYVWYLSRQRKHAAKQKLDKAVKDFPENDSQIKSRPPGSGAPLLTGLRVVDMTTMIAGPCAGRILGDLGAEVIKIEPPRGDYWRNFFLSFEPGRVFSSAFEAVNFSKKSVVLDLKKPEDIQKLKSMLKDADVFLVNVRADALRRLGLAYEQIKEEFPHLIYGMITAWGDRGPDCHKPGYDIGAFWASTGMASMIQWPGSFPMYTIGLGDVLLSSFVFSSIQLGLIHRLKTGRGQFFSSALFHLGIWTLFPQFMKPLEHRAVADYTHKPENPFYTNYKAKDDILFNVLEHGREDSARASLELGDVKDEEKEGTIDILRQRFNEMTMSEVSEYLSSKKIRYATISSFMDVVKADDMKSPWKESNVFCELPGQNIRTVRIPFDIHCSEEHGVKCRAPRLGQSTKSFLKTGWSPIDPQAAIKKVSQGDMAGGPSVDKHLGGVSVVVFASGSRVSASMTGKLLAERGANVSLVKRGTSIVQSRYPEFFQQLTKAQKIVDLGDDLKTDKILDLLETANAFVTDVPPEELRHLGIDFETAHRRFPKLVYVQSALFSSQGTSESSIEGDLQPFWGTSGLGNGLAGKPPALSPPMPVFLGDIMNAVHLFSAVTGGLFHLFRTGEGLFAESSALRTGCFSQLSTYQIIRHDPVKLALLQVPRETRQTSSSIVTVNSFSTKDGMWIQLLGVEVDIHVPRVLAALGVKYWTYLRALKIIVTKVLPSKQKSLVLRLIPVFVLLNTTLKEGFAKMTWEECQEFMKKHDLWYCPVNTVESVRYSKQAEALDIFRVDAKTGLVDIPSPIEFK